MTCWGNTAGNPPYSVCPHLLCILFGSMGADILISNIARSASMPAAILPLGMENAAQGASAPMRTACDSGISSRRTMSMTMGMDVSTPGIPPGAESKSWLFSSSVCGAWSVPIMSMPPARNLLYRASRQSAFLIGGFTL
jgi:hypothetical protein